MEYTVLIGQNLHERESTECTIKNVTQHPTACTYCVTKMKSEVVRPSSLNLLRDNRIKVTLVARPLLTPVARKLWGVTVVYSRTGRQIPSLELTKIGGEIVATAQLACCACVSLVDLRDELSLQCYSAKRFLSHVPQFLGQRLRPWCGIASQVFFFKFSSCFPLWELYDYFN
jgi:hypothetical protein